MTTWSDAHLSQRSPKSTIRPKFWSLWSVLSHQGSPVTESVNLSSFGQKRLTVQDMLLLMEKRWKSWIDDLLLDIYVEKFGEMRGSEWAILVMNKNQPDLLTCLEKVGKMEIGVIWLIVNGFQLSREAPCVLLFAPVGKATRWALEDGVENFFHDSDRWEEQCKQKDWKNTEWTMATYIAMPR
ncbi:hypothetical protein BJ742DRAFT_746092 [Cladochytrium replicatum]|nr:hypothetical protein BJ742DRAFT_746092 [Cladochytrium replicatum]